MIKKIPPGKVTMSDWNIVVIEYEEHVVERFIGYCYEIRSYRFSSDVVEYDPESNTGKTRSGSSYVFLDRPGKLHPMAKRFLDDFKKHPGIRLRLKYES